MGCAVVPEVWMTIPRRARPAAASSSSSETLRRPRESRPTSRSAAARRRDLQLDDAAKERKLGKRRSSNDAGYASAIASAKRCLSSSSWTIRSDASLWRRM